MWLFGSPQPDSRLEMLPGVCGDPSKANAGAGAAAVHGLVAKSFRGAASEAAPGPAVCSSNAAAAGTGLRRGVIRGARRACGFTPSFPYSPQGAAPSRGAARRAGFGQSCAAITWKTFICKPRVFPSQDGSQSQGCRTSRREFWWGAVGPGEPEKLAQACPEHLPAALAALAGRSAHSSQTGGVAASCSWSPCPARSETERQKAALPCAQLSWVAALGWGFFGLLKSTDSCPTFPWGEKEKAKEELAPCLLPRKPQF